MTATFKPVPRSTISAGIILATYDRGGSLLGASRIDEVVQFRLPSMAANTPKTISLENIGYPLKPLSLYLLGAAGVSSVSFTATTVDNQSVGFDYLVDDDFAIFTELYLPEDSKLTIELNGTATGAVLTAKQIGIIETQLIVFD